MNASRAIVAAPVSASTVIVESTCDPRSNVST